MRHMDSRACDLLGGEWLLYWTARDVAVPHGFFPGRSSRVAVDSCCDAPHGISCL